MTDTVFESIKQFKNTKFTHEQLRENFTRDDIKELVSVFYNLEKQKACSPTARCFISETWQMQYVFHHIVLNIWAT